MLRKFTPTSSMRTWVFPSATLALCTFATSLTLAQTEPAEDNPAEPPAPAPATAPQDTGSSAAAPAASAEAQASSVGEATSMEQLIEKSKALPLPPEFVANAKPLFFSPENNGIKLERPQLRWVIDEGTKLNLGGLLIDSSAITFRFSQSLRDKTPKGFLNSDQSGKIATHISFSWPDSIAQAGLLTIENTKGEILYSTEIADEARTDWKKRLERVSDFAGAKAHLNSGWGISDIPREKFGFLWKGGTMRACLTSRLSKEESMRMCSAPFLVGAQGDVLKGKAASAQSKATVYINGGDVGPRGILTFPNEKVAKLKVTFQTGALIEFTSRPIDIKLIDVVEDASGTGITLTGEGALPAGNVMILQQPEKHFWAKTGVTQKTIWRVTIPRSAPTLRAFGSFNIPFTLIIQADSLPKEADRLYIPNYRSGDGTYSSAPQIVVTGPKNIKVQSKERSIKSLGEGRYEWTFNAPQAGVENRAQIAMRTKNGNQARTWVANHKLFRTYPFESSARLTGVATSDKQIVMLGELAGSAWFESLGFTNNDILAHHRWGLTARYFRALTPIKINDDVNPAGSSAVKEFSVLNADLKYNVISGLWNHDELLGLIASTEKITLGATGATLLGGGAYWARTMPKIFNDLFNYLPFMDYPKYVDMEFIMYPMAISAGTKPGTSMNLNFHGKVFWAKRVYGEAGFGMKRFAYVDKDMDIRFTTFYGTAGLGILF